MYDYGLKFFAVFAFSPIHQFGELPGVAYWQRLVDWQTGCLT